MTTPDPVRLLDDPAAGDRPFVAGSGNPRLMWTYDALTRLAGVRRLHTRLVDAAGVRAGERVLDVGCGTANLALVAARRGAVVTGLDPDRWALERAAAKARRARVPLTLVRGYADHLPVDDASVDHVVSAFALHHVPTEQKAALASELGRVLVSGGRVTIADGVPDERGHGHGRTSTARGYLADNADHGIERLLTAAGLVDVTQVGTARALRHDVVYVQAVKP